MANALYTAGREGFLGGTNDWDTNTIKLVFIDHGVDTPVPATDANLSDLLGGARIGTSGAFASKSITGGTADAADVTVATVTGAQFESVNIYEDSGVESTSSLLVYIDTATGLPTTPNGGDITVQWDNGANKIFTL